MAASMTALRSPPLWNGPALCTTRSAPAIAAATEPASARSSFAKSATPRRQGCLSIASAAAASERPASTTFATDGSLATSAAAEAAPTRPVPPTNTTFLVASVSEASASDARARVDRRRFEGRATFAEDRRSAVEGEARALGAAVTRHIADADMVVCVGRTDARGGEVMVAVPNAR